MTARRKVDIVPDYIGFQVRAARRGGVSFQRYLLPTGYRWEEFQPHCHSPPTLDCWPQDGLGPDLLLPYILTLNLKPPRSAPTVGSSAMGWIRLRSTDLCRTSVC